MKICLLAPFDDKKRFEPFIPLKGSFLFRRPNLEILRMMKIAFEKGIKVYYVDEQIEEFSKEECEFVFMYVSYSNIERVYELLGRIKEKDKVILFGPLVTKFPHVFRKESVVIKGYAPSIFGKILDDIYKGKIKRFYQASQKPQYYSPWYDILLHKRGLFYFQSTYGIMGCMCDEDEQEVCTNFLYFGKNVKRRLPEEVIMEVASFPKRFVELLDDDIGKEKDYYIRLFSGLWELKKDWVVKAGPDIFSDPWYIRFLAKAGVKIVFLKKSWLPMGFEKHILKKKINEIKKLHAEKILAGISFVAKENIKFDTSKFFDFLEKAKIDFLEIKFEPSSMTPSEILKEPWGRFEMERKLSMIPDSVKSLSVPEGIAGLKAKFYSLPRIFKTLFLYPFKQGIYNTFMVYAPRAFAYRENYLEGIGFPP